MTPRRRSAMGECERRTQEALIAALFARPRTHYRAAQCVPGAGASFFSSLQGGFGGDSRDLLFPRISWAKALKDLLKGPAAGLFRFSLGIEAYLLALSLATAGKVSLAISARLFGHMGAAGLDVHEKGGGGIDSRGRVRAKA
jgi:hypothetical protein